MTDETGRTTWPTGDGEMAERIRAHDWAATPLGPVEAWPQSLKTMVDLLMANPVANILVCGPERVLIYNDACIALYGDKHPSALGSRGPDSFPELWGEIGPLYDRVFAGEMLRFEAQPWRFDRGQVPRPGIYDAFFSPVRDESGNITFVHVTAIEVTDRVRAESALRASEERQAFLLELSDRLRSAADPQDAMAVAAELFARRLNLAVAHYLLFQPDGDSYEVAGGYSDGRIPTSLAQQPGRLSDHGPGWGPQFRSGEAVFSDDHETRSVADAEASRAFGIRSGSAVPLIRDGRMVAIFSTADPEPRRWTEAEKTLQKEVAERTWAAVERARAEKALRESEEEYRRLFTTMDQGFCVIEKVKTAEGEPTDFRYVTANPAFERHTGMHDVFGRTIREFVPDAETSIMDVYDKVARTGERARLDAHVSALDLWMEAEVFPARSPGQVAVVFSNVSARKRAEFALRESEERQAFLLKLSDALRPLADPVEIQGIAAELLGSHLGVGRCGYGEVDETGELFRVERDWTDGEMRSMAGRVRLEDFGRDIIRDYAAGRTVRLEDPFEDERTRGAQQAYIEAGGVRGGIGVPLVKNGRFVAAFYVHQIEARRWTDNEVALVQETAERTWAAVERARAEAALRESEEKYRTLFETMGQGYCELDLLRDPDGLVADQRYIEFNPAFERLFGIPVAEAKGRTASEVFPKLETSWHEAFDRIAHRGEPERIEYEVGSLDRWFEVFAYPGGGDRLKVLYEDVTERKRAEMALRKSEERQAFLLKLSDALRPFADPAAIQEAACRLLGDWLGATRAYYVEYDSVQRYATVANDYVADGSPSLVGRYGYEAYRTTLDRVGDGRAWIVGDVAEDGDLSVEERRSLAHMGVVAWIDIPLVKQGKLVAILCVVQGEQRAWTEGEVALVEETAERTWAAVERARAEVALRESETRLRTLVESLPGGAAFIVDGDLRYLLAEGEALASAGFRPKELVGRTIFETLPAELAREYEPHYRGALAGEPFEFEHRAHGRTFITRGAPLYSPDGEIQTVLAVSYDITDRERAQEALRESEERFRQFGDASSDVLWIRSAETLQWEYLSNAFETIYGEDRKAALAGNDLRRWAEMILPEDRESALANIRRVLEGEEVTFEYRIRRPSDGQIRWLRNTDFPLLDAAGRVQRIGGIGHDATEEKEFSDRLQVLVAELQHRTRNLIAVVRSLADKTLKESASLADFQGRYGDRLKAVSRVQGLLSRLGEGQKITFDELLRTELSALGALDGHADRVTLDGPADVRLRSGTVQTFALALHELATNAVKYGALSSPDGRLTVRWHVRSDGLGRQLHVEWRESGVAVPETGAAPTGGGYGRELIERALPYQLKAETSYEIGADGVRCTIAVPLSEAAATGEADDA